MTSSGILDASTSFTIHPANMEHQDSPLGKEIPFSVGIFEILASMFIYKVSPY